MLLKVSPQPDGIVKSGLSRLPVKEKNTGSNPVIIAKESPFDPWTDARLEVRRNTLLTSSNNSVVECLLAKQNVVSSNLTCCSYLPKSVLGVWREEYGSLEPIGKKCTANESEVSGDIPGL